MKVPLWKKNKKSCRQLIKSEKIMSTETVMRGLGLTMFNCLNQKQIIIVPLKAFLLMWRAGITVETLYFDISKMPVKECHEMWPRKSV